MSRVRQKKQTGLLVVVWMLALGSFSFPNRMKYLLAEPSSFTSMDSLDLIKIAVRILSILILVHVLLKASGQRWISDLWNSPARMPIVFASWVILSTMWSPIKPASLQHGVELAMLVLLSIAVGLLCADAQGASRMLKHLVWSAFVVSALVLILHWPNLISGRRPEVVESFMHPNQMGFIAATGLLILVGCRFLWRFPWACALLVPGGVVFALALHLSRSRTSLGAAALVCCAGWWSIHRRSLVVVTLIAVGLALTTLPYSGVVSASGELIEEYMLRGEGKGSLATANGRGVLWGLVLDNVRESPFIGFGYFSVSSTGELDVWEGKGYQTAHNALLHILAGTGLVGVCLMLGALWSPVALIARLGRTRRVDHRPATLAALIGVFCLLVGVFELSVVGPVHTATVSFFAVWGLSVAKARKELELERYGLPLPTGPLHSIDVVGSGARLRGAV